MDACVGATSVVDATITKKGDAWRTGKRDGRAPSNIKKEDL
jgi:hypothetical protein